MKTRQVRIVASFLVGVMAGGVAMNLRLAHELDRLYVETRRLNQDLESAHAETAELEQAIKDRRRRLVTGISAEVKVEAGEGRPRVQVESWRLETEKQVLQLLKNLQGRSVETIDYRMVPAILDGRILLVDQQRLRLRVELIVVAETVHVIVSVHPVSS